ncbi:MAG: hypothetical protein QM778_34160 [Myxococcales bacterium]
MHSAFLRGWFLLALGLGWSVGPSAAEARPPIVPEAMVRACKALSDGSACQFELSGKHLTGTCEPLPDKELACRPGPGKKRPRTRPKTSATPE